MIGRICKFINASTLFCFLVKCIVLVFLGVFATGIQNSYQVRYEPRLSDKARCSSVPVFSHKNMVCPPIVLMWPLCYIPDNISGLIFFTLLLSISSHWCQ